MWLILPEIHEYFVKIYLHWNAKLIACLLDVELIMPRPSKVLVRLFYNLFTCSLVYIFIFHFDHLQNISHDQVHWFIWLCLYPMIMKQFSSSKQLMHINIAFRIHLSPPIHLTYLILWYIIPLIFCKYFSYENLCQVNHACCLN